MAMPGQRDGYRDASIIKRAASGLSALHSRMPWTPLTVDAVTLSAVRSS